MMQRSVVEKCCREVLERSVIEKCWSSQHRQEMPANAQLFEYEPFRHFCISIARSSYLVYNLRLSQTMKKTAEKIDANAQWFHCSWSILLKRVNIRVRGFHLFFHAVSCLQFRARRPCAKSLGTKSGAIGRFDVFCVFPSLFIKIDASDGK